MTMQEARHNYVACVGSGVFPLWIGPSAGARIISENKSLELAFLLRRYKAAGAH